MAKQIKISSIPSVDEGKCIQVPEMGEDGFGVLEKGRPKLKDATIVDILEGLIVGFPTSQLTMANITEGIRLKNQLTEAKNNDNGVLVLEDSTYTWVKKILNNEQIGVKMLAFNLLNVLKLFEE